MAKTKVLWMSNKVLSDKDRGGTGTWLTAMAQGLMNTGEVQLTNISHGLVAHLTHQDFGQLSQWIIPSDVMVRYQNSVPPKRLIAELNEVVEAYAPDLVHVWGTEMFWGLLTARKVIRQRSLLEMQGLKWAIARVYAGGLTFQEQLACIGLKEIIRRTTILHGKGQVKRWGRLEREIVAGHEFITVQSKW